MVLSRALPLRAASRSLLFGIPLSILLLASLGSNFWHYRLEQNRLEEARAAERASKAAAALAREQAERAASSRRVIDQRSDARLQQLYDEINQLTRVSERILLPSQVSRTTPAAMSDDTKTAGTP